MRLSALMPTIPTVTFLTPTPAATPAAMPAGQAYRADSLAVAGPAAGMPAVATSLSAPACNCTIDERLKLADEADKAGSAYYSIASEHYRAAVQAATTAADCERIGDHAANRRYDGQAAAAREKAVLLGLQEAGTLDRRLAVAAKADGWGARFYDDAGRCYDEATAKATTASDLYAIGEHAASRRYERHARAAWEKGIVAAMGEARTTADRLAAAAKADGFGSSLYDDAGRCYDEATAKATTASDLYAIGEHAASRRYDRHARLAREKAVVTAMSEARTTAQRLAVAATADGFGSLFYDEATSCYAEAIAKTTDRTELTAIAQHADSRGYTSQGKAARTKALSC